MLDRIVSLLCRDEAGRLRACDLYSLMWPKSITDRCMLGISIPNTISHRLVRVYVVAPALFCQRMLVVVCLAFGCQERMHRIQKYGRASPVKQRLMISERGSHMVNLQAIEVRWHDG